jgi:hypothetical protein
MQKSKIATLGMRMGPILALVACSGASGPSGASSSESKAAPPASGAPSGAPPTAPTAPTAAPAVSSGQPAPGAPVPSGSAATAPGDTSSPPTAPPAGLAGLDALGGTDSRIVVNEHCCFNGKYFRCPNANACMGGADPEACIEACDETDVSCIQGCLIGITSSSKPPTGCDANAIPPPGVDCANGQINIGN